MSYFNVLNATKDIDTYIPKVKYVPSNVPNDVTPQTTFELEIIVPVCRKLSSCSQILQYYNRKNVFEEDHANIESITIVAAILQVDGTSRDDSITIIPLNKDSTFSNPLPILLKNGQPLILNVRWFYTRNWKRVNLL